jgi:hypothetical protein
MKNLHTYKEFLTESQIDKDAYTIHAMTACGQNAAQNFIDDYNIDSKKLVTYLRQNLNSPKKYEIRDLIKDPKSNNKLLKQFTNESVVNKDLAGPAETTDLFDSIK